MRAQSAWAYAVFFLAAVGLLLVLAATKPNPTGPETTPYGFIPTPQGGTTSPSEPTSRQVYGQPSTKPGSNPSTLPWLFVLTGYHTDAAVQKIVETPANVLVVDAYKSSPDRPFTTAEVAAFKKNHPVVLAYLSIGEAERDYRPYWKSEWNTTPPQWLGKQNPNWPNEFQVKYWNPPWQAIVFDYVKKIAAQGFSGAYLDNVDGYEYWSNPDNGEPAFTDPSFSGSRNYVNTTEAANRMIAFITAIRQAARTVNPNFKIFPQNAQYLADYPGYLDVIDGIGHEDTWYIGHDDLHLPTVNATLAAADALTYELTPLQQIKAAGKTVLVVDYFDSTQIAQAADFVAKAQVQGFYAYPADKNSLDDVSTLATTLAMPPASANAAINVTLVPGDVSITG